MIYVGNQRLEQYVNTENRRMFKCNKEIRQNKALWLRDMYCFIGSKHRLITQELWRYYYVKIYIKTDQLLVVNMLYQKETTIGIFHVPKNIYFPKCTQLFFDLIA